MEWASRLLQHRDGGAHEQNGQERLQWAAGHERRHATPDQDARDGANQELAGQQHVHILHEDQMRQRGRTHQQERVGNIGAHQLVRREGNGHDEQGDDQAAAADGRHADEEAAQRTDGNQAASREMVVAQVKVVGFTLEAQPQLAHHQDGSDHQHDADEVLQHPVDIDVQHVVQVVKNDHRHNRGRDTAHGERAHDARVNRALPPVLPGPKEFGRRGIREVSADGHGGGHSQANDQQRGHEDAASHAGESYQHAHNKAVERQQEIRCHPNPGQMRV